MNLEGGCSCGAIRYKLTESPLIVHACHCRDCQRVTGSGFVINIWIEKNFVERSGATPKSVTLKGGIGKEVIIVNGLMVTQVAKMLNISHQTLNDIILKKSGITSEISLSVANAFGGSVEIWNNMQTKFNRYSSQ